jgi:hypothetical protein
MKLARIAGSSSWSRWASRGVGLTVEAVSFATPSGPVFAVADPRVIGTPAIGGTVVTVIVAGRTVSVAVARAGR